MIGKGFCTKLAMGSDVISGGNNDKIKQRWSAVRKVMRGIQGKDIKVSGVDDRPKSIRTGCVVKVSVYKAGIEVTHYNGVINGRYKFFYKFVKVKKVIYLQRRAVYDSQQQLSSTKQDFNKKVFRGM